MSLATFGLDGLALPELPALALAAQRLRRSSLSILSAPAQPPVLERQRKSLLPVRYFHWVFTLPAKLRPLALQNPQVLYDLLFNSASATLLEFGQQRFGAELGLTAILHTWGQNLMNHPHLHCLVTGGGLTAQNSWAGPKQTRWLFPVHAVGDMFRGKFCAALLQLYTTGKLQFHGDLKPLAELATFTQLLRQLQAQRWVVFAKGSVIGPEHVLDYLGRYTHRVAISNSRLRAVDPIARTLSFTYKDYADANRIKVLPLTGVEFIRRFLLHILPQGFTKIRHYGLLGNNRRTRFVALARAALQQSPLRFQTKTSSAPAPAKSGSLRCPHARPPPFAAPLASMLLASGPSSRLPHIAPIYLVTRIAHEHRLLSIAIPFTHADAYLIALCRHDTPFVIDSQNRTGPRGVGPRLARSRWLGERG